VADSIYYFRDFSHFPNSKAKDILFISLVVKNSFK